MMKGKVASFLLFLLMTVMLSACSGQTKETVPASTASLRKEALEITEFSFFHTGMSSEECFQYSVCKTEDGVRLYTEELFSGGLIVDTIVDETVLEQLGEIAGEYDIESWDGFDENDKYVMDGSNFELSVVLEDGRTIFARGSNCFPDGYADAEWEIRELFESLIDRYGK